MKNFRHHESYESNESEEIKNMDLVYREEVYALIGSCFEVYNEVGCGFVEVPYHESLVLELGYKGIPFVSKPKLPIYYKGVLRSKSYEPDLVPYEKIIMELKAVNVLNEEHRAQVHNDLKASKFRVGLLVNFGKAGDLEYERTVR